ncbi:MAG: potassium channel family protein [Opitutales bacterium]|nr:potassium channel family protein [Opitutales bacterium]
MDLFVGIVALYSIVLLVVDLCMDLGPEISELFMWLDNGLCTLFLAEFLYRLIRSRSSLSFWKWGWLDLLASIPMFPWLRWARSVRLIRAIRILRAYRGLRILHDQLKIRRGVTMASSAIFLFYTLVMVSTPAILIAESGASEANIRTSGQAFWWVIVTMSTVGYGDFYPVTTAGRLVAIFTMMLGIGLFGASIASILSFFGFGQSSNDEIAGLRAEVERLKATLESANGHKSLPH